MSFGHYGVVGRLGAGKSHGELGVWEDVSGSYIGGNTTGDWVQGSSRDGRAAFAGG